MKLFIRTCIAVLALPLILVAPVAARGTNPPKIVMLEKNTIVNHDYFAAGDSITVSGTVNGDAYVAGGTVTMNGTINGDLFVAGGTVNISGNILHDLRAAGGTINISAPIPGNITVAGGNVNVAKDARIGGSILAGAGTLELLSPVGRGMNVGAGTLTIGNRVNGDVTAGAGTLSMLPDATVTGNLNYWSKNDATLGTGATVSGLLVRHEPPAKMERKLPGMTADKGIVMTKVFAGIFAVWSVVNFLVAFILGLIIFAVLPVFTGKTIDAFRKQPLADFGIGLLTVIALPVLAIVLCVTIIGLPLGIFLFAALGLLVVVVHVYIGLALGTIIMGGLKMKSGRTLTYLVGLIVLLIVSFIPVVGGLTKSILGLIVLGALVTQKYEVAKQMRAKKLV